MQLGMAGLRRMGSNLVRRLLPTGHECVVFDVDSSRHTEYYHYEIDRDLDHFANQTLSAMRKQFGGNAETSAE